MPDLWLPGQSNLALALREPALLGRGRKPNRRVKPAKILLRGTSYLWPLLPNQFTPARFTETYSDRITRYPVDMVRGMPLHGTFLADCPDYSPTLGFVYNGTNQFLANQTLITKPANNGNPQAIQRTMVCRFNTTNSSTTQVLLGFMSNFGGTGLTYGVGFLIYNGSIYAIGDSGTGTYNLNTPIASGETITVGARFAADGALFVNGQKMQSGNISRGWNYIFSIGLHVLLFTGSISFATMMEYPLSDAQLAAATLSPEQFFLEPEDSSPYLFPAPVSGDFPFRIGSTQINSAYFGSNPITAIYKGSTQLWP